MSDEYGRAEWKTDSDAANAEAARRVEQAIATGAEVLDFADLPAMTRLPEVLAEAQGVKEIYAGRYSQKGKAQFWGIQHKLTEFASLSGLVGLTALDLSDTVITDATALSGLLGLTSLNLSHTRITDATALSGLVGLTSLDLSGTGITDATALSALVGLNALNLRGTGITDATALSGLVGLTSLNLRHTRFTDAAALSGLVGLNWLDLGGTQVADLGFLLNLPEFAAERATYLEYSDTPAAQNDRRLDLLSRISPDRCAVETMQYLKGTHPDFREQKGGAGVGRVTLAARLEAASPIAIGRVGDRIEAVNHGAPQRVNPLEAGQRVAGLRAQVAGVLAEARHTQCGPALLRRLEAYAEGAAVDQPIYFVMDAPMQMLRGSLDDDYLMQAVDKGLQQGLRGLVVAHDALRPFLLPPSDEEMAAIDALPPLDPAVTAQDVAGLAHEAVEALSSPDVRDKVGEQVLRTLRAVEDLAIAHKDKLDRPTFLRKVVAPFGGALSVLADAITVHAWWLGPTGVILAGRIQPLLDVVLGWFRATGLL